MGYKNAVNLASGSALNVKRFVLDQFYGCDFRHGNLVSDYHRSPDCKNLIWGNNPTTPRTRYGYKPIGDFCFMEGATELSIYGIHIYHGASDKYLVHAGTKLYPLTYDSTDNTYSADSALTLTINGVATSEILSETRTTSYMFENSLYIIGGGVYLSYDLTNGLRRVEDYAFIPTVVMGRSPISGGGTAFEAINLLTRKMIYSYSVPEIETYETVSTLPSPTNYNSISYYRFQLGESVYRYLEITLRTSTSGGDITETKILNYELDAEHTDDDDKDVKYIDIPASVLAVIDGTTTFFKNIEFKYTTFDPQTKYLVEPSATIVQVMVNNVATTAYTFSSSTGYLTFSSAPQGIQGYEGVDNVTIQFIKAYETDSNLVAIHPQDKINNCSVFDIFGGANDSRIFLTGNSDYKNCDWRSAVYDATYFPDDGYTFVGSSNVPIVGYVKQYDTQMIIKKSNQEDGSSFLRQLKYDDNDVAYFPIDQGVTGTGAINSFTFGTLNAKPMFLSDVGVVAVVGTNVDYHNLIQQQSDLINSKLLKCNINNAFSAIHGNKYYLFVDGQVFVCDARMQYKDEFGRAQYEWYLWTNIPAECATANDDGILFGYKGRVYRFKNDFDGLVYADETGTEVVAVDSYWNTPYLYFSSISERKTIYDMTLYFDTSEAAVTEIKAYINEEEIDLGQYTQSSHLNFAYLDFCNFDFGTINYEGKSEFIKANLRFFNAVKFKIATCPTASNPSLSFGLNLMQIDYIYTK